MTRTELLDHLDYHYWAVKRTLRSCEALDAIALHRDVDGAYPSILKMLKHMYAAEVVWLKRWQGDREAGLPSFEELQDLNVLQGLWSEKARELTAFVSQADVHQVMPIRHAQHPLWQLVLHMINHSSFHRGQVMHFVRANGHSPLSSDLIHYLREQQEAL